MIYCGLQKRSHPQSLNQSNHQNALARLRDTSRAKLDVADRKNLAALTAASAAEAEKDIKDPGWMSSLILKIVDNIQITVESMHLRFEQPQSRGVFAAGFTIDR